MNAMCSAGTLFKSSLSASRPPADAPTPTMKKRPSFSGSAPSLPGSSPGFAASAGSGSAVGSVCSSTGSATASPSSEFGL